MINDWQGTLIVYYSWSGNTERIARFIQQSTEGKRNLLVPEKEYPLNYQSCVEQAKREIHSLYRPKLEPGGVDLNDYNTVFVGTPIWWHTMAPPVFTFLSENDFGGKRIFPFCTHAGGGKGHFIDDLMRACPHADIMDDLEFYGSGGSNVRKEIDTWTRSAIAVPAYSN